MCEGNPHRNILVLRHENRQIEYTYFSRKKSGKTLTTLINARGENTNEINYFVDSLRKIHASIIHSNENGSIDAVAIRAIFGGSKFSQATVISNEVIKKIEGMIPNYPEELPSLINLIQSTKKILPDSIPIIVFENAFFKNLNDFGHYGLLHEAAMRKVNAECNHSNINPPSRLISICLELPHPEVVAIMNGKPLLVATEKWSNKEILTSAAMTWKTLPCKNSELSPVLKDHCSRIVKACQSAAEIMGGIDTIVFSGYFYSNADYFGHCIAQDLRLKGTGKITWTCFEGMRDRLIADTAEKLLLTDS